MHLRAPGFSKEKLPQLREELQQMTCNWCVPLNATVCLRFAGVHSRKGRPRAPERAFLQTIDQIQR